jgi:hypothetical protein
MCSPSFDSPLRSNNALSGSDPFGALSGRYVVIGEVPPLGLGETYFSGILPFLRHKRLR